MSPNYHYSIVTILAFAGAVITAFLPSRYRGNLQNRNASLVSAILEGFLAVCFIVARIYEFVSRPGLMSDDQAKQMFTKYGGWGAARWAVSLFMQSQRFTNAGSEPHTNDFSESSSLTRSFQVIRRKTMQS